MESKGREQLRKRGEDTCLYKPSRTACSPEAITSEQNSFLSLRGLGRSPAVEERAGASPLLRHADINSHHEPAFTPTAERLILKAQNNIMLKSHTLHQRGYSETCCE